MITKLAPLVGEKMEVKVRAQSSARTQSTSKHAEQKEHGIREIQGDALGCLFLV